MQYERQPNVGAVIDSETLGGGTSCYWWCRRKYVTEFEILPLTLLQRIYIAVRNISLAVDNKNFAIFLVHVFFLVSKNTT
jgi:hypothetical protein